MKIPRVIFFVGHQRMAEEKDFISQQFCELFEDYFQQQSCLQSEKLTECLWRVFSLNVEEVNFEHFCDVMTIFWNEEDGKKLYKGMDNSYLSIQAKSDFYALFEGHRRFQMDCCSFQNRKKM